MKRVDSNKLLSYQIREGFLSPCRPSSHNQNAFSCMLFRWMMQSCTELCGFPIWRCAKHVFIIWELRRLQWPTIFFTRSGTSFQFFGQFGCQLARLTFTLICSLNDLDQRFHWKAFSKNFFSFLKLQSDDRRLYHLVTESLPVNVFWIDYANHCRRRPAIWTFSHLIEPF